MKEIKKLIKEIITEIPIRKRIGFVLVLPAILLIVAIIIILLILLARTSCLGCVGLLLIIITIIGYALIMLDN